jgi:hypothetical protein
VVSYFHPNAVDNQELSGGKLPQDTIFHRKVIMIRMVFGGNSFSPEATGIHHQFGNF